MANYIFIDQKLGNDSPSATGTVQRWPLMMTAAAVDVSSASAGYTNQGYGEWVYVAGATNGGASKLVALIGSSALPAGSGFGTGASGAFQVGMALGNLSNSSVYGWVQVKGGCDYGVNTGQSTSIAANAPIFLGSTTGGIYTTASATGFRIHGIAAGPVSYTSSQSTCSLVLNYPNYIGQTANM